MQTLQLLTMGVGTAVTLGLTSSATWGTPQAIAPEVAPQFQALDLRSVRIGSPSPTTPGTLGAVQFLTAAPPAPANAFTALMTPLLNQVLPTLGTASAPPLPIFPPLFAASVPSAPLSLVAIADKVTLPTVDAEGTESTESIFDAESITDSRPEGGIDAEAVGSEVDAEASAAKGEPGVIAANSRAEAELEATEPGVVLANAEDPEQTANAKGTDPEANPKVEADKDTDVVDAGIDAEADADTDDGGVDADIDADAGTDADTDTDTELEAAQSPESVAIAGATSPLTPQTTAQVTPADPHVAASADGEVDTKVEEVDTEVETDADAKVDTEADIDADAKADTWTDTPNLDAATSPSLTAATPPQAPQTELPEARELQETSAGDRAEAITPKAVSVNDPYTNTEGPIPELNPNPDLLYLPDKPEEVQIQLTQPINLRQAVEQALSNSLPLQDARLRLDRSLAQLREAQAAWHPTVSLQSVLQRVDSSSTERTNRIRARNANPLNNLLGTADTVTRAVTGRIGVDWAVFTSGRRMANIRAARQQVRISELEVKRQTDIIILDVSNSYFDLQEADAQVRIAEAAVNSAQQSLRDAQLQFQAGVGTRFDVLRAEVQLANEKQNLTNRLAQQQVARRQLSQQLNVPQTVNLVASSRVEVAGTWRTPLEETIIQAYKNRPGLEQRLAERELRRQQRRAELAATLPQIGAFADYDVLKNLDDGIGLTDGNTVGVRLDWRLYDGGAARARARQRSIEAEIAEVGFSDIRNQIRFEVERAYSSLLSNFENIDTARLAVEQAEEALRLARLRFQAGVGTQTEVIDAETDLTNARGNLLQAVINYNRSLATLERAVSLPIAESQSINEGSGTPIINGGGVVHSGS
ncbi:TolC family protein [Trichothermofontia sp.]